MLTKNEQQNGSVNEVQRNKNNQQMEVEQNVENIQMNKNQEQIQNQEVNIMKNDIEQVEQNQKCEEVKFDCLVKTTNEKNQVFFQTVNPYIKESNNLNNIKGLMENGENSGKKNEKSSKNQRDFSEDSFDGQYTDSGDSDSEEEEEEENEDEEEEEEEEEDFYEEDSEEENQRKKQVRKNKQVQKNEKNRNLKQKDNQYRVIMPKKSFANKKIIMNVAFADYNVVKYVGKKIFGWKLSYEEESNNFDVMWTDKGINVDSLSKLEHHQKINHFPGIYTLARKNNLCKNLYRLKRAFPEEFRFIPQTWLLPTDLPQFRQQFENIPKNKARTFIVKPEAGCQGRGIFLTRSINDFDSTQHYVVQRYLHRPHLIDGLKYDLRIYVLLAGCDPLRIYMFEEGLARFATEEYELPHRNNLDDLCMHLTNYAINKNNSKFEFNDDEEQMDVGHKRSLTSIWELFKQNGWPLGDVQQQIKDIIIKTICSGQPVIAHEYKTAQPDNYMNNMCFQILGFDVMLDNKFKPYLIEVNHLPSFATDTPLDAKIKKNAIRDALNLMNINIKTRNEILKRRHTEKQTRVLTGKKIKLSLEEKQEEIRRYQILREEWESQHMGGYEKLYPIQEGMEDNYLQYIQEAAKGFGEYTGTHIRRNEIKQSDIKINTSVNKTQSFSGQYQQNKFGSNWGTKLIEPKRTISDQVKRNSFNKSKLNGNKIQVLEPLQQKNENVNKQGQIDQLQLPQLQGEKKTLSDQQENQQQQDSGKSNMSIVEDSDSIDSDDQPITQLVQQRQEQKDLEEQMILEEQQRAEQEQEQIKISQQNRRKKYNSSNLSNSRQTDRVSRQSNTSGNNGFRIKQNTNQNQNSFRGINNNYYGLGNTKYQDTKTQNQNKKLYFVKGQLDTKGNQASIQFRNDESIISRNKTITDIKLSQNQNQNQNKNQSQNQSIFNKQGQNQNFIGRETQKQWQKQSQQSATQYIANIGVNKFGSFGSNHNNNNINYNNNYSNKNSFSYQSGGNRQNVMNRYKFQKLNSQVPYQNQQNYRDHSTNSINNIKNNGNSIFQNQNQIQNSNNNLNNAERFRNYQQNIQIQKQQEYLQQLQQQQQQDKKNYLASQSQNQNKQGSQLINNGNFNIKAQNNSKMNYIFSQQCKQNDQFQNSQQNKVNFIKKNVNNFNSKNEQQQKYNKNNQIKGKITQIPAHLVQGLFLSPKNSNPNGEQQINPIKQKSPQIDLKSNEK